MSTRFTFAHISDSHLVLNPEGEVFGQRVYQGFERAIAFLAQYESEIQFVVHTGDIVHKDSLDAYPHVAELARRISRPWYFVRGNYDDTPLMNTILPFGPRERCLGDSRQTYAFSIGEERFVVLDSAKDTPDWCGRVEQQELDFLADELRQKPKALTVFIHYPPFSAMSPWADRQMVLVNGNELHRVLTSYRASLVRGVFFGHIHRFYACSYDGILYASAPSTGYRFATFPGQQELATDTCRGPSINLVSFEGGRTTAREFVVP
ncbi:MAG: hypothetical protein RL417_2587 [Pseudomonadota bacterium]|jgi:Icc protein